MISGPGDTLNALLQSGALVQSSFTSESRYYALPVATFTTSDGRELRYVRRRFIPQPGQFVALQRYRIVQGDRIDVIASHIYGEPLFFWRICDANVAMRPEDVTAIVGAYIRLTLAAGMPGG